MEKANTQLPVLPLRDVVVYPHMVIPLFVGREKSIRALENATEGNKGILLVAQKSAEVDDPSEDDLYPMGTLSNILQLLKLPDGTVKVLVEGNRRAQINHYLDNDEFFLADVTLKGRATRQRRPRNRRVDAYRTDHLRSVCQAEQKDSGRGADLLKRH